jgi:hypothetical protein
MQRQLAKNRPALTEAGVAYLPLEPFRSFFTSRLMKLTPGKFDIDDHSDKFFTDGKRRKIERLLISDENLAGWCDSMLSVGVPFKGGVERLERFRQLFPDAQITLFCSIRSYESFLTSAYCEILRHRETFVDFRYFWDRFDFELLRWPSVIDSFVGALKPIQIKLWQYEEFRLNSDKILQDLAFGVALPKLAEDQAHYASFSQLTVELLEFIAAAKGGKIASRVLKAIDDSLPKADGNAPFDPWSNLERSYLADRYKQDCKSIDPSRWLIAPTYGNVEAKSAVAAGS